MKLMSKMVISFILLCQDSTSVTSKLLVSFSALKISEIYHMLQKTKNIVNVNKTTDFSIMITVNKKWDKNKQTIISTSIKNLRNIAHCFTKFTIQIKYKITQVINCTSSVPLENYNSSCTQ